MATGVRTRSFILCVALMYNREVITVVGVAR